MILPGPPLWPSSSAGAAWLEHIRTMDRAGTATYRWARVEIKRLTDEQALGVLFSDEEIPRNVRLALVFRMDDLEPLAFGPPDDWRWGYARNRLINESFTFPGYRSVETREDWWAEELRNGANDARDRGRFGVRQRARSTQHNLPHASSIDVALEQADNVYKRVKEEK